MCLCLLKALPAEYNSPTVVKLSAARAHASHYRSTAEVGSLRARPVLLRRLRGRGQGQPRGVAMRASTAVQAKIDQHCDTAQRDAVL